MPEQDSLSEYDFSKVSKPGKFLKFEAGKPVTVRILTKDPVVQEKEFEGADGTITLSTKFNFIVWNFTDEKAQILSASPKMATTFQRIANDEDFGTNLQQCDIKISPEGEKLQRTYDVNVLRHSGNQKQLTSAQVKEAQEINLDKDVQDNKGRLSKWEGPSKPTTEGYEQAKAKAKSLANEDPIIEDIGDEHINLDDIPF